MQIVKSHRKPKLRTFEQYRAATEAEMKMKPKPVNVDQKALLTKSFLKILLNASVFA